MIAPALMFSVPEPRSSDASGPSVSAVWGRVEVRGVAARREEEVALVGVGDVTRIAGGCGCPVAGVETVMCRVAGY